MTMSKPYVVGIDIGGTNTVFGIVDARGTIIASGSIKTNKFNEVEDSSTNFILSFSVCWNKTMRRTRSWESE